MAARAFLATYAATETIGALLHTVESRILTRTIPQRIQAIRGARVRERTRDDEDATGIEITPLLLAHPHNALWLSFPGECETKGRYEKMGAADRPTESCAETNEREVFIAGGETCQEFTRQRRRWRHRAADSTRMRED